MSADLIGQALLARNGPAPVPAPDQELFDDWVVDQTVQILETAKEKRDCRLGIAAITTLAKIAGFM